MVGGTINPIKIITKGWDMGLKGKLFVICWGGVTVLAVYFRFAFGDELNAFGQTLIWVIPIGSLIVLGVWVSAARLKVSFNGAGRPGKQEHDSPYNVGEAIFEYNFTINNIGGKKLTLKPLLVLIGPQTNEKIGKPEMMVDYPLPMKRAIEMGIGEPNYRALGYCPRQLVLEPDMTEEYHIAFHLDRHFVDLIGSNERGTIRVYSAIERLQFADNGRNILFECNEKNTKLMPCKKSKLH